MSHDKAVYKSTDTLLLLYFRHTAWTDSSTYLATFAFSMNSVSRCCCKLTTHCNTSCVSCYSIWRINRI